MLIASATIAGSAWAIGPDEPIELKLSPALTPPPGGEAARKLPIILRAQTVTGRPDLDAVAQGDAEFRQGNVVIRADRLSYDQEQDLAVAHGNVSISRDGNVYSGPELQLKVQRFEGFFLNPTYHFSRTGGGGTAQQVNFIDDQRSVAIKATYTSCPPDGPQGPAWLLTTDRVSLDFANNEGVAEGGVLRFLGVPILAAPSMSFPLTDDRKSGWLPPSIALDIKSGVQLAVPYYWDIAPNRDATFTPEVSTRRGASMDSEFRYLAPDYGGQIKLNWMPHDTLTGTDRYALTQSHDSDFGDDLRLQMRVLRVSDSNYWKDFPREDTTLTPRLLASNLQVTKPFGDWSFYARLESWQVLQTADAASRIEAPYDRSPQIGTRYAAPVGAGFDVTLEGEFNRFTNPTNASLSPRPSGIRLDALGSISRPFVSPGWSLTPTTSRDHFIPGK